MNVTQRVTQRGFVRIEFQDDYREPCSLQESSAVGEPRIWLGTEGAIMAGRRLERVSPEQVGRALVAAGLAEGSTVHDPEVADVLVTSRMHLTREHAGKLAAILAHFAATGELGGGAT